MIREYIIKVDEDKKDIMGGTPLEEPPKELVRCNDCIKCQAVNRRNLPPGMYCPVICADVDPLFYCALGMRRGGDGK